MEAIKHKGTSYEVKDVDEKKGVIEAYANVYNNKDSDGDISANGAFTKTVSENFKRIRVLKNHDSRIMLGVPLEIDPKDMVGLRTISQFNMKKDEGRDMFTDIQLMKDNGLNAELSIGYQVMKRDAKNREIITEYKLYEYSFLTSWAANPLATVQNIKSDKNIIDLIMKSYDLPYSDARLKQIETLLKSLEKEEAGQTTSEKEEPNLSEENLSKLMSIFKIN